MTILVVCAKCGRETPQREGCEHNAVGNYLRYDETRGPNGETVHACAYHMEQAPLASCYTTFRHGSGWFHTIEEAKAFIVNAVSEAFQGRAAEARRKS